MKSISVCELLWDFSKPLNQKDKVFWGEMRFEVKKMSLVGFVKENKIVLPERINLPEGSAVELMVIEKETLEPSEKAKRKFWELVGVGEMWKVRCQCPQT